MPRTGAAIAAGAVAFGLGLVTVILWEQPLRRAARVAPGAVASTAPGATEPPPPSSRVRPVERVPVRPLLKAAPSVRAGAPARPVDAERGGARSTAGSAPAATGSARAAGPGRGSRPEPSSEGAAPAAPTSDRVADATASGEASSSTTTASAAPVDSRPAAPATGAVVGRCTDLDGRPVSDAQVEAVRADASGADPRAGVSGRVDTAGRFRLALPPGAWIVRARRGETAPVEAEEVEVVAGRTVTADVVELPTLVCRVTVRDAADRPAAGALVRLTTATRRSLVGRTDASGVAVLYQASTGVLEGRADLSVRPAPGPHNPWRAGVRLPRPGGTLAVRLEAAPVLRLTLRLGPDDLGAAVEVRDLRGRLITQRSNVSGTPDGDAWGLGVLRASPEGRAVEAHLRLARITPPATVLVTVRPRRALKRGEDRPAPVEHEVAVDGSTTTASIDLRSSER